MKGEFLGTVFQIAIFLLSCGAGAATLEINGDFEKSNGKMPASWLENKVFSGYAAELIKDLDNQVLAVKTPGKTRFALMNYPLPLQIGDQLEFSVKVKGRGSFVIGGYCYNKNAVWVGRNLLSESFSLDEKDWCSVQYTVVAPEINHPVNGALGTFRPVLEVNFDSDLLFDDYCIEHTPREDQTAMNRLHRFPWRSSPGTPWLPQCGLPSKNRLRPRREQSTWRRILRFGWLQIRFMLGSMRIWSELR